MGASYRAPDSGLSDEQKPAIRFLIESALRTVITKKSRSNPSNRQEWVAYLAEALISESETPYQSVLSSLMANGVSSDEIYHRYIPDTARFLGELWVSDKASFVDVTMGAARLQSLYRNRDEVLSSSWMNSTVALGHSVLMIIPQFEEHSLGAFVAADDLRHHGFWVHMSIGMDGPEIAKLIVANSFTMLGISLATPRSIEQASCLIDYLRKNVHHAPPVVIGGHAVQDCDDAVRRTGADFAAKSAKEAIEMCGLTAVSQPTVFDELC